MRRRRLLGRPLVLVVVPLAALAGCGRVGPPRQPGPREAIVFPRTYPQPDPPRPGDARPGTPALPAPAAAAPGPSIPADSGMGRSAPQQGGTSGGILGTAPAGQLGNSPLGY
jgi:predicted small lipoprotein YifL